EVTRVVTPGTLTEDDLLDPKQPNHLAVLHLGGGRSPLVGLAWVDLATSCLYAADAPVGRVEDDLGRLRPSECLYADGDPGGVAARMKAVLPEASWSSRPDWTFDPDSARAVLFHHFGVTTLAGFGFEDDQACVTAAGALLLYLQETLK